MKIFTIELSSKFGSIALIEEGQVLTEMSWVETFKNRQQLFDSMAALEVDWDSVDLFAVGRGPGAFSGMRIGFSVANSLAAPAGKPVYALNSGASIATQVGLEKVLVVGDARRNKVWAGLFQDGSLVDEFKLLESAELAEFVPPDTPIVSPDLDRLTELLASFKVITDETLLFPKAGVLGQLVDQRIKAGISSEPCEPLYMHPPVFIKPRFPAPKE